MNRLSRYVGSEIILYAFFTLAALIGVFAFFDLLNQLDEIGKGNYQFVDVVIYVLLGVPANVYELLPVAVLIGGIYALSMLAGNSELTVMRVSGVSLLRLAKWLAVVGALFALTTVLLGEYIAPVASGAASRHRIEAKQQVMVGSSQSGIWIKDGRQIANIAAMLPDLSLSTLRIYEFDDSQRLETLIEAGSAYYDNEANNWTLESISRTHFPVDQSEVTLTHPAAMSWNTSINPDMLAVLMVKPQDMSMRALYRYVQHLQDNGQNAARYELALWNKIFYPFACISMMLIALPFALVQKRSGGVGVKIFMGILLGVGFNFLNKIMGHLGALYNLPAPVAAALPTLLLFTGVAVVLWRQSRN